jgi:hypothetical protein
MNRCYVCNGSIKTYSHKEDGKLFCSSMCVHRYKHWRDNEQLSLPLATAIKEVVDGEDDACKCHRCRDP